MSQQILNYDESGLKASRHKDWSITDEEIKGDRKASGGSKNFATGDFFAEGPEMRSK